MSVTEPCTLPRPTHKPLLHRRLRGGHHNRYCTDSSVHLCLRKKSENFCLQQHLFVLTAACSFCYLQSSCLQFQLLAGTAAFSTNCVQYPWLLLPRYQPLATTCLHSDGGSINSGLLQQLSHPLFAVPQSAGLSVAVAAIHDVHL